MPPDAMLARRMEALTLGVLGQLGATANWHRIAREWLFGDPPSTPLGEQEAEFFGPGEPRRSPARPRWRHHDEAPSRTCAKQDVIGAIVEADGPLDQEERRRGRPKEAYGALLRSIVGQQLSTKAARHDLRAAASTSTAARPPRPSS